MKQLRLPQSTLSENLQALQRHGYVETVGREGRAIVYRLGGAARLIVNVLEPPSGKMPK
jgi:DNA-binding IclR family transcriptional regulator